MIAQWILAITALFIGWQACETRRAAKEAAKSVGAIRRQTDVLERQTQATEKAANAALENVELIINKERARLRIDVDNIKVKLPVFSPEDPMIPLIEYSVSFVGTTPAFITDARASAFVSENKEMNPPSLMRVDIEIINHDTETQKALFLPDFDLSKAEVESIHKRELFVHFFASIKYKDVFDRERETVRTLRWMGPENSIMQTLVGKWEEYGDNHAT